MLEAVGTVVEVEGDTLLVETHSHSACSHCSSSDCTSSLLTGLFGPKRNQFRLKNRIDAGQGDRVVIGLPERLLAGASVLAYLLPLMVMICAAVIGHLLGAVEGVQSLLALLGLVAGFVVVHRLAAGGSSRTWFKPHLLRISGNGAPRVELPNTKGVKDE